MLAEMQETAKQIIQKIKDASNAEEALAFAKCLQALMTAIGIAKNVGHVSS
mgnify:CR=1 FL=1